MSQSEPQRKTDRESDSSAGPPPPPPANSASLAVLATAGRELAGVTDPGWTDAADRVVSAVRSATRRSTPVNAVFGDGRDGDVLQVSDLVVVSALRAAMNTTPSSTPQWIELLLGGPDGHDCLGVRVELVARYGSDLRALTDDARDVAVAALSALLGPPEGAEPRTVDLAVADIVEGDPRV